MTYILRVAAIVLLSGLYAGSAFAESYVIDTKGAHASINFRIQHLGYSWLTGRFDNFGGSFEFDPADPAKSSVSVEIDMASINSNHAARDKHLRSADFLDVGKFPKATFKSKRIVVTGKDSADIVGDLTLRGVTKEITIKTNYVGGGKDPWGGFRRGFAGTVELALADFGITYNLGPKSRNVLLSLNVEGIRQ